MQQGHRLLQSKKQYYKIHTALRYIIIILWHSFCFSHRLTHFSLQITRIGGNSLYSSWNKQLRCWWDEFQSPWHCLWLIVFENHENITRINFSRKENAVIFPSNRGLKEFTHSLTTHQLLGLKLWFASRSFQNILCKVPNNILTTHV